MNSLSYRFAQGPWHLIRQYAGIYNIDVSYKRITTCLLGEIILAGQLSNTITQKKIISLLGGLNGQPERLIVKILKEISTSKFKKQFYIEISKIINAPKLRLKGWIPQLKPNKSSVRWYSDPSICQYLQEYDETNSQKSSCKKETHKQHLPQSTRGWDGTGIGWSRYYDKNGNYFWMRDT